MVRHVGSSASLYLADPTSPIPSHCASIVTTSTLRANTCISTLQEAHTIFLYYSFTLLFFTAEVNWNFQLLDYQYIPTFCYLTLKSVSHSNWCTGTLLNRITTAQWEGMGDVGSARYKPALLPPCPSIRVLCYNNCQRSTHSHQLFKV